MKGTLVPGRKAKRGLKPQESVEGANYRWLKPTVT